MPRPSILLVLAFLSVASLATAGQLSPGLEAYLAAKSDPGPVSALMILTDQVDVAAMDLDLHLQRTDLATRHYRVVTALQEKARATQGPLLADLEARLGQGLDGFTAYWLVNAVLVRGTEDAIRAVAARDDVDVAEMDILPELIEPVETAPAAGKDRGIGITEGLVSIGARRVWDELGVRGEGALVGSFDTGVDGQHPALADRWRGNHAPAAECWLDVVGAPSAFPTDNNSHGTHTCGTMVGLASDDTIGVAPAAEWIAVNAIDQGAGSGFDSDVLECLQFFTDPDGDPGTIDDVPDVVQNSWRINENFPGSPPYVDCDSRWWAAIDACEAAGVMLCWSAGNEGPGSQTLGSPADRATTLYNCFSVGSTQTYAPFEIAQSSSRGPAGPNCGPSENRIKPEIAAPGVYVYSAVPGGDYAYYSGTSMAGPHVAGVVALMRSANPDVDVITMKRILMETAQDLGDLGDDNVYGNGFVDAYAAVSRVLELGWVVGVITDAGTGQPIAGAVIDADGSVEPVVSDAAGAYRLTLPAGPTTVTVSAFGYAGQTAAASVTALEISTQDFALTAVPSVRLSGVVHRPYSAPPDQWPADGAVVVPVGTPLESVTTGPDGRFEFELPVNAEYRLQAGLSGTGSIEQLVPLGPTDLEIDLYLGPLIYDGFESGDLGSLPWEVGGDAPWYVQDDHAQEGIFSARSGDVGADGVSNLEVTVNCGTGGAVSFWFDVSSEEDWDFLEFYVDNVKLSEWSGLTGWLSYETEVAGGDHTFNWVYVKDRWNSHHDDCAWIDAVTFPGGSTPVPRAVAAPWELDYGELSGAEPVLLPLVIMNQGAVDLDLTVTSPAPFVSVVDEAALVPGFGYHVAGVVVDATDLPQGSHQTHVSIDSNDPANPSLHVLVRFEVGTVSVIDADGASDSAPDAVLGLRGAVPNPFNPQTTVHYSLPASGHVDLQLYDVRGRLVRSLVGAVRPAGANTAQWDGRDDRGRPAGSGTYVARLRFGGEQRSTSLVLVR